MKKLPIYLILLVCVIASCKSSNNSSLGNKDFLLTIEFSPSFLDDCRITIEKEGDVKTLSIDKLYYKSKLSLIEDTSNLLIEKSDSLIWSRMSNYQRGDSVFIMPIEKVLVSDENFQLFTQDLINIDLSTQENLVKQMLDGVTVYFRFQSESIDNIFAFKSPHSADTTEFQIITGAFNLIDNSIKSEGAINYIKDLKEYF